jgi:polyferredoxin
VWLFSSAAVRVGDVPGAKDSACTVVSAVLHAQPADDPWGFEEEEEDMWRDVIRPQIADVGLTAAFLAFAMVSFFKKSVRLKYVTFVLAIAYMGFYKSNLISVVNIFGVMDWNLPIAKHNVMWYVFAIFTVTSTVLWGRLYCGRICAYGALTQLMDATLPRKLRVEPPAWLEQRASWIKYGLLAAVIGYYLVTHNLMVYRYVEPFWLFARTSSGSTVTEATLLWTGLGLLLLATVFVRNLYCRFLCPVGAMLGIMSNLTVFNIKRWSECKTCKICEKTCEWGAIRGPRIIKSECVRCDDCERLYANEAKCPHHLIIIRKADIMARRSVAPVSPAVP